MVIKKNPKNIWNKIYSKYAPAELPWFNLKFPKEILRWLHALNKDVLILIPGCGVGDTANAVHSMGLKKVVGTDISKKAVITARNRFPKLKFETIETEKLGQKSYANVTVFDWLNLHHISKKGLNAYLHSLQKISKILILAYIFEPELGETRDSYITGGKVYNHSPSNVLKTLSKLQLKKQFRFKFKINPRFGNKSHKAMAFLLSKNSKSLSRLK